jgi:hypothetical protein
MHVCNSVVHIVNRVLLPSSNLSAIPVYDNNAPSPGTSRDCNSKELRNSVSQRKMEFLIRLIVFLFRAGVGTNGAAGLAIGTWAFALSGALAAALMM